MEEVARSRADVSSPLPPPPHALPPHPATLLGASGSGVMSAGLTITPPTTNSDSEVSPTSPQQLLQDPQHQQQQQQQQQHHQMASTRRSDGAPPLDAKLEDAVEEG